MKKIFPLFAALAMVTVGALPASAFAQRRHDRYEGRKVQKEQWKDVAIVGSVVGLVGAATHNPTLAAIGAAGAAYGGVRYENERRDNYGYGGYGRREDRRRYDDRDGDRRYDHDARRDRGPAYRREDDHRDHNDSRRWDERRSDDRRSDDRNDRRSHR